MPKCEGFTSGQKSESQQFLMLGKPNLTRWSLEDYLYRAFFPSCVSYSKESRHRHSNMHLYQIPSGIFKVVPQHLWHSEGFSEGRCQTCQTGRKCRGDWMWRLPRLWRISWLWVNADKNCHLFAYAWTSGRPYACHSFLTIQISPVHTGSLLLDHTATQALMQSNCDQSTTCTL